MASPRRQAKLFSEVGSGRALCLCSAELQPEAQGGRGGAGLQLLPGSQEKAGLSSSLGCRDSQAQLHLSHASQPHSRQPRFQQDRAGAGPSGPLHRNGNFHCSGGRRGMGLLLPLL